MTEPDSPSDELTKRHKEITAAIEATLDKCVAATDAGNFSAAHRLVKKATSQIKELRHLMQRRRGQPRTELQNALSYYEVWQRAVDGWLKVVQSGYRSQEGILNLEEARSIAVRLSHEYWGSTRYIDLAKKVATWQAAARQRKTQN